MLLVCESRYLNRYLNSVLGIFFIYMPVKSLSSYASILCLTKCRPIFTCCGGVNSLTSLHFKQAYRTEESNFFILDVWQHLHGLAMCVLFLIFFPTVFLIFEGISLWPIPDVDHALPKLRSDETENGGSRGGKGTYLGNVLVYFKWNFPLWTTDRAVLWSIFVLK